MKDTYNGPLVGSNKNNSFDLAKALSYEINSYDAYKDYPHIDRTEFSYYSLPDDLKTEVSLKAAVINLGIKLRCHLYSVTQVTDDLIEVAIKLDDSEKFNSWKFGNQNSSGLKSSLESDLTKLLPEGLKIDYIKFKQGSFIIIIGLTIIAGVAGKILGAAVFFGALSGLTGLYRILSEKKEVKEFFENFDRKIINWIKSAFETIGSWINNTITGKVALSLPIIIGASVLLGPWGGAAAVALVIKLWGFGGGSGTQPILPR